MIETRVASTRSSAISEVGRLAAIWASRGGRLSVCIVSEDAENLRWRMLGARDGWAIDFYCMRSAEPSRTARRHWIGSWTTADIASVPAGSFDVLMCPADWQADAIVLHRMLKQGGIVFELVSEPT